MDLIPIRILGEKITIIGAGAIGSWVALSLAKMGFGDITVYDHDVVDTVNLNSQFYPMGTVGNSKVVALANLIKDFTGTSITIKYEKYEKGVFPGIVIAAVDSMAVRKTIWENHRIAGFQTKAVIDPRMGAESALLYCMNPTDPKDQADYAKSLYTDDSAVQERCTAKATIYTANLLAGLVVKAVKDRLTKPDYLRSAMWDIAANAMECHTKRPV
jgi:molybdopterin/thiamine biosynthesis adenylyltransferase